MRVIGSFLKFHTMKTQNVVTVIFYSKRSYCYFFFLPEQRMQLKELSDRLLQVLFNNMAE